MKTNSITDACQLFDGRKTAAGYGYVTLVVNGKSKSAYLHREIYQVFKGDIPKGYQIDHLCSMPPCVNPDHLEAVTPEENIRRAYERLGSEQVCRNGHIRTEENTIYYYYTKTRLTYCKDCSRIGQKLRYRIKNHLPLTGSVYYGRSKNTHCKNGHELTPENVKWSNVKNEKPYRRCLMCQRVDKRNAERRNALRKQILPPDLAA